MNREALDALEAWVDGLEAAGDDPDRIVALGAPPSPAAGRDRGVPPDLRARAVHLWERMAALEARLEERSREVGRALSSTHPRPAPIPHFIDEAF